MKFFIDSNMRFETIAHEDMPAFLESDDPLILKTSWEAFNTSTTSYTTHSLKNVAKHRLEFTMSFSAFIFYVFFILFGLFIATLPLSLATLPISWNIQSSGSSMTMVLVGLFFSLVGIILFYFGRKKIVIDKATMLLTKGKDVYRLNNVKAVQLLQDYVDDTDGNDNYYSHQLNLIFSDGDRVNIVSGPKTKVITKQAETVSEFLGVVLWDGRSTNYL